MTVSPSPRLILDSPENKAIAVIGAGSWGTTLAQLLAEKGQDVRLWVREPEVYADLTSERIKSTRFYPGCGCPPCSILPRNIRWPWTAPGWS